METELENEQHPLPDQPTGGEHLLTVQMVGGRLAMSARQVWRLCDSGRFPRPLSIGPRCKRWRASDIDRFLRELQPRPPA